MIGKARQLGLDPEDLSAIGRSADRAEWVAVGDFFEEYLQILDHEQVLDYSELIHRAVILAQQPQVQAKLRTRVQGRLRRRVPGHRPRPDRAAPGDRRRRPRPGRGRRPGPVDLHLPRRRRARAAAVHRRVPYGGRRRGSPDRTGDDATLRYDAAARVAQRRQPARRAGDPGPGHVRAVPQPGCERLCLRPAARSRRTCTRPVVPSSSTSRTCSGGRMCRTASAGTRWRCWSGPGSRSIPPLRRALAAAGIPVDVAGDELPLSREPAVRPMLLALRAVADPATLTVDVVRALALSPLGAMDAGQLRRLARVLRQRDREAAGGQRLPRSSDELLREALLNPLLLDEEASPAEARFVALGERLLKARNIVTAGARAGRGDVVAVVGVAVVAAAARRRSKRVVTAPGRRTGTWIRCARCSTRPSRAEEQVGFKGVSAFLSELESLDIAGDNRFDGDVPGGRRTADDRAPVEGSAVAAGRRREVQEGQWPDLRRRGSLLEPDRLGPDGLVEPLSAGAMLAEERRLFYVAITRARERLIVTAVQAPEADGDQPSRFLAELDIPLKLVAGRPRRPLSLPGLVADLRCVLADPASSPALKRVAADRLALLADAVDDREHAVGPDGRSVALVGRAGADRVGAPDRGPGAAGAVVGECADDDRGLPAALVPAAGGPAGRRRVRRRSGSEWCCTRWRMRSRPGRCRRRSTS